MRRQEDDRRSAAERDIAAPGLRDGSAASAGGTSAELEAPTSAFSASTDAPAGQHSSVSLDGFLELVHLEHLSPLDLRVLLRVTDREATVSELAASMGQPPTVLGRASARLAARGLLRRRRRRSRHDRLEITLATTASGMGALWRVSQALGIDPGAAATLPVTPDWPAKGSNAIGHTTGRPAAAAPPRIDTGARTG
jgi:DNA-binding MarR family transcriptional regulator